MHSVLFLKPGVTGRESGLRAWPPPASDPLEPGRLCRAWPPPAPDPLELGRLRRIGQHRRGRRARPGRRASWGARSGKGRRGRRSRGRRQGRSRGADALEVGKSDKPMWEKGKWTGIDKDVVFRSFVSRTWAVEAILLLFENSFSTLDCFMCLLYYMCDLEGWIKRVLCF